MEFAQNLLSTRRGTIALAGGAALLAGILLLVYLKQYRESVKGAGVPASVLVAQNLIQKGAPGDIIGSSGQFRLAQVPKSELREGALTDPSALRGRVAAVDIYPGQQLTETDFVYASPDALENKLGRHQRAIAISLDSAHGMIGNIQPGDHVDVFVGLNVEGLAGTKPILKLLMQDALVLRAPLGGGTGNVVLRTYAKQAAALAFAADNGKIWLVLRPAGSAAPVRPGLISVATLLGVKPVRR